MIIPPIGAAGQLSLSSAASAPTSTQGVSAAGTEQAAGAGEAASGSSGSFGSELTQAISSLEQTQQSANSASQALATGKVTDPESAVVTVEDAQMAMDLASQLRTKATEAVQNIFATQV